MALREKYHARHLSLSSANKANFLNSNSTNNSQAVLNFNNNLTDDNALLLRNHQNNNNQQQPHAILSISNANSNAFDRQDQMVAANTGTYYDSVSFLKYVGSANNATLQ